MAFSLSTSGTIDGLNEAMLSSCNVVFESGLYWADSVAVKEAVEGLRLVTSSNVSPLEAVREQLSVNGKWHAEFVAQGGAKALCELLSSGSTGIHRKCMQALESLATNEETRHICRDSNIVEVLLKMIRPSNRQSRSKRKDKAGEIIKLLAGCQQRESGVSARSSETRNMGSSMGIFRMDCYRERPLPLWYHTTNPILPWDAEAVSCLVDMLMTDLTKRGHEAAQRIIKKILHVSQYTRHIILDKRDIADMVDVISSVHSSAMLAMKVVTYVAIMHPSNDITFVRTGGLEGLVQAMRSDNIGSICGEMAAWTVAYFAAMSPENARKVADAGGGEALVELLHSPDFCSREASARACVCMLRSATSRNSAVRQKLGEANAIPALLSVLQDGQYHSRQQAVVMDVLRALMEMAKTQEYRREILEAGGIATISEGAEKSSKPIRDASDQLQKLVLSRSARLRMALRSRNKKSSGFAHRLARGMLRIFRQKSSAQPNGLFEPGTMGPDAISGSPKIGRWPTRNYADLARQRNLQRQRAHSTVSLTSFGAFANGQSNQRSNDTIGEFTESFLASASAPSATMGASQRENEQKETWGAGNRAPSIDPPTAPEDLAVVVVTLNTQSSCSDDYLHRSIFTKSSRSDLIATRDFY
ncbi:hypothetical protein BSKO_04298 [Bryopsis sp. KO-2023]|nr:hypothetical protein BSKO_04298 [Bryopsis sp. KO-2023]